MLNPHSTWHIHKPRCDANACERASARAGQLKQVAAERLRYRWFKQFNIVIADDDIDAVTSVGERDQLLQHVAMALHDERQPCQRGSPRARRPP